MSINIQHLVDTELTTAQEALRKSRDGMLRVYNDSPVEIQEFVQRVFAWKQDSTRKQWIWELFHEVIDFGSRDFNGNFGSFVSNYLLDDSEFRVEWRKPAVDSNGRLIWGKGGFETVVTTKEDPAAEPVVVSDFIDGRQNVSLLMEAMDHMERRHEERIQENEKVQKLLREMRK